MVWWSSAAPVYRLLFCKNSRREMATRAPQNAERLSRMTLAAKTAGMRRVFACPLSLKPVRMTGILTIRFVKLAVRRRAGCRIQEEISIPLSAMAEVEHIVDWTRNRVKRSAANALALEPVVFNEANDRTLVRSRVIDEVFTGKGRNHEERQARPIAAAALRVRGADAGQCGGTAAGAAG